jgi:hypothetical protein
MLSEEASLLPHKIVSFKRSQAVFFFKHNYIFTLAWTLGFDIPFYMLLSLQLVATLST